MRQQPSLIYRMLRCAPMESIIVVVTAVFAIYGVNAFEQYVRSQPAQDAYTPLIFAFGRWPFYLSLLLTVGAALRAYIKAEALCSTASTKS